MAKAKDGTMYGSQMGANQRNASMPPSDDTPAPDAQPKSIMDDPKAMKMVDELKQMGYTADDVEQAMGGGDDQMQGSAPTGQEATQAASLAIPGMR